MGLFLGFVIVVGGALGWAFLYALPFLIIGAIGKEIRACRQQAPAPVVVTPKVRITKLKERPVMPDKAWLSGAN